MKVGDIVILVGPGSFKRRRITGISSSGELYTENVNTGTKFAASRPPNHFISLDIFNSPLYQALKEEHD